MTTEFFVEKFDNLLEEPEFIMSYYQRVSFHSSLEQYRKNAIKGMMKINLLGNPKKDSEVGTPKRNSWVNWYINLRFEH